MMDRSAQWTIWDKIAGAALLGVVLVGSAIAALYGWRSMWPPGRWYQMTVVRVDDVLAGQRPVVSTDRRILRDFNGRYVTTVRSVPEMKPLCSGGQPVPYRSASTLPEPTYLDWWTAGAIPPCMGELRPGKYVLTTCIFVQTDIPLIGEVKSCVDSNIFEVRP